MNQKYLMMISGLVSACILISGCTNNGYHDNRYDDEYAGDVTESGENRYSEETEIEDSEELEMWSDKGGLNWKWVVNPEDYEDCYLVSEDWFAVKDGDGKYMVVDEQEKMIFSEKYDEISFFSEDVSAVREDGKIFFIDKNGQKVSGEFQAVQSFHETLAAVEDGGLWGYINHKGNVVIDCQFMEADSFCEGYAAVKKDGKWGFINQSGVCFTGYEYEEVKSYQEEFAAVKKDGKWGFINQSGVCFTGYEYEEVKSYQESYAAVKKDGKWGFVDSSGQIRIDLKYDEVGNFSEGKAPVKIENYHNYADSWAYINSDDEVVVDFYPYMAIEGLMIYVGEFHDGMAFVSKDLYCIIDDKGEYIFRDSCFFISSLSYDAQYDAIPAYVYTDKSMTVRKYGLVGLNGEQRLEPVFDYVHGIYGDYVLVSNKMDDGEWRYGFIKIWEESDKEMSSAIEEEDNLSSYTKAQIATEEFCLFEGTWEVTEYLDTAVEYHAGIDYEDEEYIRQVEEYIKKYQDKYLGKQLIIRKDTIEMFGPITELGYYVESSGWLFDSVRQPSTLGIEPPFVCADILLKDSDEYFYMIYDDNGRMLLDVAGKFFELEK